MNMSLYELWEWLTESSFPSFFTIWTWLITVPWWLAILTVVLVVFFVRMTWDMTCYFLNSLFDWTFEAGKRFGQMLRTIRTRTAMTIEYGKYVKKKFWG
jgi:hypothetical protein